MKVLTVFGNTIAVFKLRGQFFLSSLPIFRIIFFTFFSLLLFPDIGKVVPGNNQPES